jgi:hypothetical protein
MRRLSPVPSFANKAAVLAGLTLPYSNGPVEGHTNRLKLIKRESWTDEFAFYLL